MPQQQHAHWERVYADEPRKFGVAASEAAQLAAPLFRERGVRRILELGCGPGRDTLFFASLGLYVTALDYAESATSTLDGRARAAGFDALVATARHDLRNPLPFPDGTFDACYSHMTLCMEFSEVELRRLWAEIRRILTPDGLHVYTVRATSDPDVSAGSKIIEGVREVDGYAIRFFDLALIERFAHGARVTQVRALAEGAKRLWWVVESR